MSQTPEEQLTDALSGIHHRADLLPLLFRLRRKPYSLDAYPQFRELYITEAPSKIIYMCGRQIGKSTNLSKSEILELVLTPFFQILYVAPLEQQAQRYSTLYMRNSIRECRLAQAMQKGLDDGAGSMPADTEIVRSVYHQTFNNDAGIQLTYAKTSPDRARGIYADRIDFDEIQDQMVDCVNVITESGTNSPWSFIRYTGTAKTADNTIEHLWQSSSMFEWTMKCPGCGHWNQPTLENDVLSMIRVEGPSCSSCGHLLNVREGLFVPAYPERNSEFMGFHIPQIVVPAIVEDLNKWNEVVAKALNKPYAYVLNEVLGISADKGARLLTGSAVDRACVLPSPAELEAHLDEYILTVLGVDWGMAEQTSFTVFVVIGVRPDGKIHVLNAHRFLGCDPDEVLLEVAQAFMRYKCAMVAADIGMGFVNNSLLQSQYGLPVVSINYVAQNQLMHYSPMREMSRWTVDKTTALTLMFLSIMTGKILFPGGGFMTMPMAGGFSFKDDLLSPFEKVQGSPTTSERRVFDRTPNCPDDFAQALTFAAIVAMHSLDESIVNLVPDTAYALAGANLPPDRYLQAPNSGDDD